MSDLTLTMAIGDYDHVRDLVTGRVRPVGIDLRCVEHPIEEIFYRFTAFREWDLAELSFSKYCSLRASGDESLIAVPVFPSRVFRHEALYVTADSEITSPEQLRHARVGIPEWVMTATVYVRGILADEYGVGLAEVEWIQAGLDQPGREELVPPKVDDSIDLRVMQDQTLQEMLLAGDIDAIVTARPPRAFREGAGTIRRLLADPRAAELESFRRTGMFPIMHVLAIRGDIFEAHPWIGPNLVTAFTQAKLRSIERLLDSSHSHLPVPWATAPMEEAIELMGEDPWPYGVDANRPTLEPFLRWLFEQGICERHLSPEDLFPASVRRSYRV